MYQSKLVKYYQTFSKVELNRFSQFVKSPYFNKNGKLIKLNQIITNEWPYFSGTSLKKKELHKSLIPDEKFDPQSIYDLFSYLLKLAEQFWHIEFVSNKDDFIQHKINLQELNTRNLDKYFDQLLPKIIQKVSFNSDENYLLNRFQLETIADQNFTKKNIRVFDAHIQEKMNFLDLFFFSEKLRTACEMLNRQNIIEGEYQIKHLNYLQEFVQSNSQEFTSCPSILIYGKILKTLIEDQEPVHYEQLKVLMGSYSEQLNKNEATMIYGFIQNYCIKKINVGLKEYETELFAVFKEMIDNNFLLVDNNLSQWDYKNIITLGCRTKNYKWVDEFMESFKKFLPEEEMQNAYYYNRAAYLYEINNLDKSMEILQSVTFSDLYYQLGGRALLLKIYYEANEFDALDSLIDSFKMFLRRSKTVSKYQYKSHMNLIRMTKYLMQIKTMRHTARRATIEKRLKKLTLRKEKDSQIANVSWIDEKMNEFQQKNLPKFN